MAEAVERALVERKMMKLATVTNLADQIMRTREQMKVLCGDFYAARTTPYRILISKSARAMKKPIAAAALHVVKQVEREGCPIKLALAIAAAADAMEECCG